MPDSDSSVDDVFAMPEDAAQDDAAGDDDISMEELMAASIAAEPALREPTPPQAGDAGGDGGEGRTARRRRNRRRKPRKAAEPQTPPVRRARASASAPVAPGWAEEIPARLEAGAAHAFLLHGNVRDYMTRRVRVIDGVAAMLDPDGDAFEAVATYDIASGLRFGEGEPWGEGRSEGYAEAFDAMLAEAGLDSLPSDPVGTLSALSRVMSLPRGEDGRGRLLLFVDHVEMLAPDGPPLELTDADKRAAIVVAGICRSDAVDAGGSCLVMLTDSLSRVSSLLRDSSTGLDVIRVPQPGLDERADFVSGVLDVEGVGASVLRHGHDLEDAVDAAYLARSTAGLSLHQIEGIVMHAAASGTPITGTMIREAKRAVIESDYGGVLEVMEVGPHLSFDTIGGLETVKRFFRDEVIDPIHEGNLNAVPMGVLLEGPAGTGKTVLAKAVASESGINCLGMDLNNVYDGYGGGAEGNLDRALACALAMAPTIVFIDEIDEALPNRHGEFAGAGNKVNKTLLTFMSDTSHRGKVMFIGATNYGQAIDPAFRRAGRFDKRIPVFAPTGYDRVRIMRIAARKASDPARGEVYAVPSLVDPDLPVPSPFADGVAAWVADNGYSPEYVGDMVEMAVECRDSLGTPVERVVAVPTAAARVIGRRFITVQELYRSAVSLMPIPSERMRDDARAFTPEPDEDFYGRMRAVVEDAADGGLLLSGDAWAAVAGETPPGMSGPVPAAANAADAVEYLMGLLRYYDKTYRPFMEKTDRMTGAELDVVMQKAISLYRARRRVDPSLAEAERMAGGRRDVPWDVLYDACDRTVGSTAGVKSMEDNALLDTSDLDFVPDAVYGRTRDGQLITYRQRLEELRIAAERVDDR